uniref:Uncharacterized protein n=1 Tax=Brassica campestris TaxID=3711 RepID=M4F1K6_BRACM
MPVPDNYSRAKIDDMVHGIYRDQEMSLDKSYKRLDDVYYPINDQIDRLNVRMDELKEEIYMIQRQTVVRSEDYPFIDGHTRPSIDTSHTPFRGNLVTVKLLEDKLDEINFSQDLLKEDIPQRLEDIVEATHARLRMQQGCIGHLQERMQVNEVAREVMKNKWTRGNEAIRSFVGTWFQMIKEDVYILFSSK